MKDSTFMLFTVAYILLLSLEFQLPNYIAIKLSQSMPEQNIFSFINVDLYINGINMLGILRTENTIVIVVLAYLVSRWVSKFKDYKIWLIGFSFYSLGYIVISYSNNVWILLIFMLIASIGELMYIPVHKSYLAEIPPENSRSSYMAVNELVNRGAMLIAFICISISEILPPLFITFILIGMSFIGLSILVRLLPRLERRKNNSEKVSV